MSQIVPKKTKTKTKKPKKLWPTTQNFIVLMVTAVKGFNPLQVPQAKEYDLGNKTNLLCNSYISL
jgi:hypothetical protein